LRGARVMERDGHKYQIIKSIGLRVGIIFRKLWNTKLREK
jgi:hypothetical protein